MKYANLLIGAGVPRKQQRNAKTSHGKLRVMKKSGYLADRAVAGFLEWSTDLVGGRRPLTRRWHSPLSRASAKRTTVAVDVQGECPPKRSAKISRVYAGIVSDVDAGRVAGDRRGGGFSASMYRLTVSLWRPNSLAILRMDMPSSLAFWTAFHRACCRNVGLLGEAVTVMETTSSSSMTEP